MHLMRNSVVIISSGKDKNSGLKEFIYLFDRFFTLYTRFFTYMMAARIIERWKSGSGKLATICNFPTPDQRESGVHGRCLIDYTYSVYCEQCVAQATLITCTCVPSAWQTPIAWPASSWALGPLVT